MKTEVLLYASLLFISVFISAVSQIILKKSAVSEHRSFVSEYLNARVIGAYALFGCAVILDLLALKKVPVSFVPVIESSSYVFVIILGRIFLDEKFTFRKTVGMLLILAGIALYIL